MDAWLDFAFGPLFRFTFAVMVLGLLRHVVVALWGMIAAYRRTAHQDLSWRRVAVRTIDWLVPVRHVRKMWLHSLLSLVFHVGVIVTPLFLFGHIQLIRDSVGLSWPALPMIAADWFTVITLVALAGLLASRIASPASRGLSRPQDYALPMLLALPFATGFLVANTALNPLPHNPTLLVHLLSAELCFLLAPFTKLAHMALLPLAQLPPELGWRFPADGPEAVARQIGTEGRPI